jgi:hypothetical protein
MMTMSVLPGHEDLQLKSVLGFDSMGFALVQHGADIKRYKLFVGPGGALCARPYVEDKTLPDQLQPEAVAVRHRNIDQL